MNLTTTLDKSHLPAAEASRKASADADATLEAADQGRAAAAERLSSAVSKLRKGDTTVSVTQLSNLKVDVERHGYIYSGATSAAHGAKNAIVNVDTSVAEAMAFYLQGDGYSQFPVNAVVGVNPPTAALIDPLRPVLFVQQAKPADLSRGGFVSGDCVATFYPVSTLEEAPAPAILLRMLQRHHLEVTVDNRNPIHLGGAEKTAYSIRAKNILPMVPTLRGGLDFEPFLNSRGNVALNRLKTAYGRTGVVRLGAVALSAPSVEDGITTATVAVRVEVGVDFRSQWGNRDEYEKACAEAATVALAVSGPKPSVGNVTVQVGKTPPVPTIALRTTVRTLAGDAGVTAEATEVFTLKYRHEDAPEDVANPDDVVTGADGQDRYRWEL
jgi:hypothetical protein